MRVASEQASGEKIQVHGSLLGGFAPALRTQVDFYTVSHNIKRVKVFFAKWYKKVKSCRCDPGPVRPLHRSAVAARAPISPRSRSARRSTCFVKVVLPPPRLTISVRPRA